MTQTQEYTTYYIYPMADFGFKRIFGIESNKDLLMAFLNKTLSEDTGIITDLTYLQQEQIGNSQFEKDVIFDIYCTNQNGDHFIIEMQRSKQHFFTNRIISYVSRAISRSLRKGDFHYKIPTVYSVNLLDFQPDMFPEKDKFFWRVMLKDDGNRIFSKKILLFFFKLSNFAAQPNEKRTSFENDMVKWLYYLKNIQNMDEQDLENEKDPIFRKLLEQCKYSNLDNMEQEEYKKSLLEYEGIKDAIACAREDAAKENFEQGLEQGLRRGREEGREEGLQKGLAEGIEKGRQEMLIQMARKMLHFGVPIADIIRETGLDEKAIKS